MDIVNTVLFLLLALVISGVITRAFPVPVPLPLVQIALGSCVAFIADFAVELRPDVFFLLFLPPLLFLDGWRIPKEGLFRDKGIILELALGLVIFTVLGVGVFIHWLIPDMPLAVCFALAAILSPTDPIAVSAIAARVPIPRRLMHILEGESLLNDASGLVCMRFAVAAALTGSFSLVEATGTFLWLALGGIAVGAGVTASITWIKNRVTRKLGEDPGSQVLVSLLIPFAAYMGAELIECSGILSAVAAGITMSYCDQSGQVLAATRIRRTAVWETVQFTANGIIFVLLGEQLPRIIEDASRVVAETGHDDPLWLLVYVLAINLALALLRFLWVFVSLHFNLYLQKRQGREVNRPGWRLVAATSLAGVRGAITLAGILTLPLTLADGITPFPLRDLAIFLAAGVIIASLLAASVGLPHLLKGLELPAEDTDQKAEDRARVAAAEAAIRAIEEVQHRSCSDRKDVDLYVHVGAGLMEIYRRRIDGHPVLGDDPQLVKKTGRVERDLRVAALQAERQEIYRQVKVHKLSDETARKLVHELDLLETRYS